MSVSSSVSVSVSENVSGVVCKCCCKRFLDQRMNVTDIVLFLVMEIAGDGFAGKVSGFFAKVLDILMENASVGTSLLATFWEKFDALQVVSLVI